MKDTKDTKVILVVDDDEGMKEIINAILIKDFSNDLILDACDGEIAFEIIEKVQPDIVISDVDMPNKNGLVLLTETRKKFPRIPFIMMSGKSYYKEEAEKLGASFIEKPFSLDDLVKVVKEKIN